MTPEFAWELAIQLTVGLSFIAFILILIAADKKVKQDKKEVRGGP